MGCERGEKKEADSSVDAAGDAALCSFQECRRSCAEQGLLGHCEGYACECYAGPGADGDGDSDGDADAGHECDAGDASIPSCVRYVDLNAPADGHGLTWKSAFNDIQTGVQAASALSLRDGGCEIWVAQGRYFIYKNSFKDTLSVLPQTKLYGGFAGKELYRCERDWKRNETIIDGHKSSESKERVYHVVTAYEYTRIDGFTITGGNAGGEDRGGGVSYILDDTSLRSPPAEIWNCRIMDNTAWSGGGLDNQDLLLAIADSEFIGNHALFRGGGASVCGHIENTIFFGNTADDSGGAIETNACAFATTSQFVVSHVVFINNSTISNGGAIYALGPSVQITDTVFDGNHAANGGAVYGDSAILEIQRNIFMGNSASVGGAIFSLGSWDPDFGATDMTISKTIFVGNGAVRGGAVASENQNTDIDHATFYRNRVSETGASIYYGDLNTRIYGSILDEDPGDVPIFIASNGFFEAKVSNVRGGLTSQGYLIDCINKDSMYIGAPLFIGDWKEIQANDQGHQVILFDLSANWKPGALAGKAIFPSKDRSDLASIIVDNGPQNITLWQTDALVVEKGDEYQIMDFHLRSDSPCIDKVKGYTSYSDMEGTPCYDVPGIGEPGEVIDMGAYEYIPSGVGPWDGGMDVDSDGDADGDAGNDAGNDGGEDGGCGLPSEHANACSGRPNITNPPISNRNTCDKPEILARRDDTLDHFQTNQRLEGAGDEVILSCATGSGPDHFYQVYLQKGERLQLRLEAFRPDKLDVVLGIFRSSMKCLWGCDEELMCADTSIDGPEELAFIAPRDGWYTIVVDSNTDVAGDDSLYFLFVTLECMVHGCGC